MGDWIDLARVRRARGLRGEVVILSLGSAPERFVPGLAVHVRNEKTGTARELQLESVWFHGGDPVLKFEGVDTRNAAEELAGTVLSIEEEDRPPAPDGEHYLSDLIGWRVETVEGRLVGDVVAYADFGAAPLLEVRQAGREILIPFTEAIYREIDRPGKRIVVDLPAGLEELNAK